MKTEFSSQRREMLLFLPANMAAVTSRSYLKLGNGELGTGKGNWERGTGNGERERGTGKMKNRIWLGFFRVPVLP